MLHSLVYEAKISPRRFFRAGLKNSLHSVSNNSIRKSPYGMFIMREQSGIDHSLNIRVWYIQSVFVILKIFIFFPYL